MTGYESKKKAALDEEGMYLVHQTARDLATYGMYITSGGKRIDPMSIYKDHLPNEFTLHNTAPQPEQKPVAVYGYCPKCGAKGVMRERRPNGNDKCAKGHTYPSNTADPPKRPWVGLTDEEYQLIYDMGRTPAGMMEMVEIMLKDKNT